MRLVDLRLLAMTLTATFWLVCRTTSCVLQISWVRMTTVAETADMLGLQFDGDQDVATFVLYGTIFHLIS